MALTSRARRAGKWLLGGIVAFALFAVGVNLTCASLGGTPSGARLTRMEQSPHYADGKFHNEELTVQNPDGGLPGTLAQFVFGNGKMVFPSCELPLAKDVAKQLAAPPASGLRVTWFGHSSTLIEIDGRRVLTDPQWSERASPFPMLGPRRFHPPAIPIDQLPALDAVLISHDHYDHLDMNTVKELAKRGVEFHVALGVGAHLERWGVPAEKIIEHDWWEERALPGGVRIVSTPARHFSGRRPWRQDETEWTSWSIIGPSHRVFFSGDSGMTNAFKTIGEKLGPFDLAMFEIGQWNQAWGQIHLGPHGALQAFTALGAKRLLPIHWSTFNLGLHAWNEPPEELVAEGEPMGVEILTPLIGQPIEPTMDPKTERWWRKLPPIAAQCPPGLERGSALDKSAM